LNANVLFCRFYFEFHLVYEQTQGQVIFLITDFEMCANDSRTVLQYAKVASHVKLTKGNLASWPCVDSVFDEHESSKIGPRCF